MGGRAPVRDVELLIVPAVREMIEALPVEPLDVAACRLARLYARTIDQARDDELDVVLEKLGPRLLAVLAELGATPAARARLLRPSGAGPSGAPASPLDAMRAARAAQ